MTNPEPFSVQPYIREIGRGKQGARSLSAEQACTLFSAVFRGELSDVQLGAVLIALRVKGESTDELLGCLQAADAVQAQASFQAHLQALNEHALRTGKPVLVIPSYNGARRKPNFTPLMAGLLAKAGFPVLVHGLDGDPTGRVTTHSIVSELDWGCAGIAQPPVFLPLSGLHPGLHRLIKIRELLGVRNVAHTLVKLWVPSGLASSVLITSYTHPEFWHLQRDVLAARGQTALILRGHEGEAVAAPYKIPRMDAVQGGSTHCVHEGETLFSEQPNPNPDISPEATAKLTLQWLQDSATIPHGFLAQLKAVETVVNAKV